MEHGKILLNVAQGSPGPSQEDVAAASKLGPEQQKAMIQTMVARLAERLQRLMQHDELKSRSEPEGLRDDAPWVRASEEGVAWDVIPSPPPVRPQTPQGRVSGPPDAAAHE